MFRQRESNPHFLPRHNDPVIEFSSQAPLPRSKLPKGRTSVEPPYGPRPQPPMPSHHQGRTSAEPPYDPRSQPPMPLHHQGRTSAEPPYDSRSKPPTRHPEPQPKPLPMHQVETPPQPHQESRTHLISGTDSQPLGMHPSGRGHHSGQHSRTGHHRGSFLRAPASRQTRPIAWLIAAFCALFWVIVIVGGLIILIVYLVFRPRNPRFDISSVTFNAAYLDMGYLLNADITVLANFTNPNTKVNVDFSYVILDLYYEKNFVATRYIEPFSVMKRESRFADVHMVASQVRLPMRYNLDLQKQIDQGRVNFEVKGLFKARSKLGGIFKYSYWLNANCHIVVGGPPTGVLIGKKCITKR